MDSQNKKYEILPHSADLKIKITSKTKEEVFANALLAMAESMRPEVLDKEEVKRKIQIKSLDSAALLADFLNEALYLGQVNKEAYFILKLSKLTDRELAGEVIGKKVERFGEDIKAVTYHDLEIRQTAEGEWETIIIFDV